MNNQLLLPARRISPLLCQCAGCRETIVACHQKFIDDTQRALKPVMNAMLNLFKIPERIKANDEEFLRLLRELGVKVK